VRSNPELRAWLLTPERSIWITICLALVLAPHALHITPWVIACFAMFALWRVVNATRGTPLPSKWLVILLSVAMLGSVYLSYGTLFGRNAGVALLVVLSGMKLMESRTVRDAYVLSSLGFFLVITNFLYSQTIATGTYMLVVVVLMTATLISFSTTRDELGIAGRLRLSAIMLVQAVPLVIALFVLFPRLPGPLWGLPRDAHSAVSGLSDSMTPGRISRLTYSDAVAFRVKFHGRSPEPGQLYWRGPVMWNTDGSRWTAGQSMRSWRAQYAELQGDPIDYTVTIEPHQQSWLFALDVPTTIPPGAQMTEDFQLRTPKPVRERRRYEVRSHPLARMSRMSLEERTAALSLPAHNHPRARALALSWRDELGADDAIVTRALDYFRRQPFVYTLTPPLLDRDPVDQFLFDARQGFCEHYASAFAVLMRAAGIPARIVTGYQGGERNLVGDYLIVRQRDAHAWAEVWLAGRGWVRVDPTGAVSPNRIQLGLDAVISTSTGLTGLNIEATGPAQEILRQLRHSIDAINASWNEWVLGYSTRKQLQLLALFGIDATDLGGLSLGMLLSVGLVLGAIGLWLARRPATTDPVLRVYRQFCTKLSRAGVQRRPGEGPLDFAARVATRHPKLREPVARVTALYIELRYADSDGSVAELRRAVATFRPR
jgi:transglutaminase-like putative cysteine protease